MNQDKKSIKGIYITDLAAKGGKYIASWCVQIPEIEYDSCIKCMLCQDYCPEGAISVSPDRDPKIDYRFCKGCGICAHECPRKAIKMKEAEAL